MWNSALAVGMTIDLAFPVLQEDSPHTVCSFARKDAWYGFPCHTVEPYQSKPV